MIAHEVFLFLALGSTVWRPTPSRLKPVPQVGVHPIPLNAWDAFSGTGFSREEAGVYAIIFAGWQPTPSRLKPVLRHRMRQQDQF